MGLSSYGNVVPPREKVESMLTQAHNMGHQKKDKELLKEVDPEVAKYFKYSYADLDSALNDADVTNAEGFETRDLVQGYGKAEPEDDDSDVASAIDDSDVSDDEGAASDGEEDDEDDEEGDEAESEVSGGEIPDDDSDLSGAEIAIDDDSD
eukprot:gene16568-80_t